MTSSMRNHHGKYFFGTGWDDAFISKLKLKLCLISEKIQNGHHFGAATIFFT